MQHLWAPVSVCALFLSCAIIEMRTLDMVKGLALLMSVTGVIGIVLLLMIQLKVYCYWTLQRNVIGIFRLKQCNIYRPQYEYVQYF